MLCYNNGGFCYNNGVKWGGFVITMLEKNENVLRALDGG